MKLYFSPFSPYVRKCLVVAQELGLASRMELLPSNAHPVQRDAEIIASNPLGKVPTFFTDDGQVLYDSQGICGPCVLPSARPGAAVRSKAKSTD